MVEAEPRDTHARDDTTRAPAAAAPVAAKPAKTKAPPKDEGPAAEITIDDFMKVDLRVAKVLSAVGRRGARQALAVTLDVGALGSRDIFAGLRPHVAPETLVGRMVVVVANLAPRKMKFGVSTA